MSVPVGGRFDAVAAHDLLQRLALQPAAARRFGHVAVTARQQVADIAAVEALQGLFLGRLVGQGPNGGRDGAGRLFRNR